MIELERVVVDRRNMQVLHTIMQSQRASILEKQEAELALAREEEKRWIDLSVDLTCRHIATRREAIAEQRRALAAERRILDLEEQAQQVQERLKEVVDNYWGLIEGCIDVVDERREDTRGHKRKLPAAGQLKKIDTILKEHNGKCAKMVVAAMRAAGSNTDR